MYFWHCWHYSNFKFKWGDILGVARGWLAYIIIHSPFLHTAPYVATDCWNIETICGMQLEICHYWEVKCTGLFYCGNEVDIGLEYHNKGCKWEGGGGGSFSPGHAKSPVILTQYGAPIVDRLTPVYLPSPHTWLSPGRTPAWGLVASLPPNMIHDSTGNPSPTAHPLMTVTWDDRIWHLHHTVSQHTLHTGYNQSPNTRADSTYVSNIIPTSCIAKYNFSTVPLETEIGAGKSDKCIFSEWILRILLKSYGARLY